MGLNVLYRILTRLHLLRCISLQFAADSMAPPTNITMVQLWVDTFKTLFLRFVFRNKCLSARFTHKMR
jgi:hypothetical protein